MTRPSCFWVYLNIFTRGNPFSNTAFRLSGSLYTSWLQCYTYNGSDKWDTSMPVSSCVQLLVRGPNGTYTIVTATSPPCRRSAARLWSPMVHIHSLQQNSGVVSNVVLNVPYLSAGATSLYQSNAHCILKLYHAIRWRGKAAMDTEAITCFESSSEATHQVKAMSARA